MAKVIISGTSCRPPGEWSRLWIPGDVYDVLTNKSGTKEVEGLVIGFPANTRRSILCQSFKVQPHGEFPLKSSCISTEAFANMKKLRLLMLTNVQLNGEYKHLPKELIWLCWEACPLKSLPDDFFDQPRALVILEITFSNLVQVWEGSKSLENLKILNLGYCEDLKKSPDLSNLPSLEELILEWCASLSEIHPSIGHLKKLSLVNLTACCNLISLPGDFYESKSVRTLVLNYCSQFSELSEDLGKMISLRVLKASGTAIRQVPHSTVRLKNLTHLSLMGGWTSRFKNVTHLQFPDSLHGLDSLRNLDLSFQSLSDDAFPKGFGSLISLQDLDLSYNDFHTLPSLSGFSKLERLRLNYCRNLHTIYGLPTNLKFLNASDCSRLVTMPNFSKMSNMRELHVRDSHALTEVPDLDKSLNSMTWINMRDCPKLTAGFMSNVLKGWTSCGYGGIFLNGNYVPDWFEFVNDGNKVSFDILPSDGRNFEGLTLLCFYCSNINESRSPYYTCKDGHPRASIDINNTKRTELQTCIGKEDWVIKMRDVSGHCFLWQGQISNDKLNLQSGDKVDITFEMPKTYGIFDATIQGTGVNLVWDKPMKENEHDFDGDGRFLIQRHNQGGDASSSSHV
ncbi:unnamed protein product [Malus baccata var. baccata]